MIIPNMGVNTSFVALTGQHIKINDIINVYLRLPLLNFVFTLNQLWIFMCKNIMTPKT